MRNCLGDMKIILDANGGKIEWRFIEQLHNLQDKEDLRPGNKLPWLMQSSSAIKR
jgi:hypothetical protein